MRGGTGIWGGHYVADHSDTVQLMSGRGNGAPQAVEDIGRIDTSCGMKQSVQEDCEDRIDTCTDCDSLHVRTIEDLQHFANASRTHRRTRDLLGIGSP